MELSPFHALFDDCPIASSLQEMQDGRFVEVNRAFLDLTGYGRDEIVGRTPDELQVNLAPEQRLALVEELRREGSVTDILLSGRRKSGEAITVQLSISPVELNGRRLLLVMLHDITACILAQNQLRASEVMERERADELQALMDAVPVIVWIARDPHCHDVVGNRAACELLRVPPGANHAKTLPESESTRHYKVLHNGIETPLDELPLALAMRGTPVRNYEEDVLFEDGARRHLIGNASPLYDPRGEIRGAVAAFSDITEFLQAEEARRASETRFSAFFRNSPIGISISRLADGRLADLNSAFADLFGYAREELLGRTPAELGLWADPEMRGKVVRLLREQRQAHNIEALIRAKSGDIRTVVLSGELIDVDGEPHIAALVNDVTEQKRAERELRASEARFATVFNSSPVAIAVTRLADNRLVAVNPAWQAATGCTWQEALGHTPIELGMWSDPAARQRLASRLREEGTVHGFELRLRRKSGEIADLLMSAGRIDFDGEPCMLSMAADITQRKQAEQAMLLAQKAEALSTLAGGIAHDFNNLLLAITGNVGLAGADLDPGHPARASLDEIARAAARADYLVQQIAAFGRTQEPRRRVLPLQPAVVDALKLMRVTLPATIKLVTRFDPSTPPVACGDGQVSQVIVNLVTNAVQAIAEHDDGRPASGLIEVSIDAVDVDAGLASLVTGLRPGRYARLTVSDDGCGMDDATLLRIFDPFFTTRRVGQGAGLGLPAVHGIMRSHGGAIAVHSQPGQGTTFRLYFPAAEAIEPARPAPAVAAASQGERVLFVDDEDALVFLMSRVLKRLGYAVTGFTNPARALAAFQARPADFDVVVTDLSMPEMNGFELTRALLEARPDVPIVMTTGYIRPEDQAEAAQLGIREVILKPNTADELGHALRRLFQAIASSQPEQSTPISSHQS